MPTRSAYRNCLSCCRRKDNLQTRVDAKIAKKHEKRDKKLMRAGFEGRRETPINT